MSNIIQNTTQVFSRTGIITAAGTLLARNDYRTGLIIQNLNGTDKLYVKFGADASSSDFDLILKAGAAADDGTGGTVSYDVLSYTGIISVAGSTVRCVAVEF